MRAGEAARKTEEASLQERINCTKLLSKGKRGAKLRGRLAESAKKRAALNGIGGVFPSKKRRKLPKIKERSVSVPRKGAEKICAGFLR